MKVGVHRVAMSNPTDVSGLQRLIESGQVDPAHIVASIGKTEGNGGANDFTRALATLSFSVLLAHHLGASIEEVSERVAFVWSGGCEGVISPHATFFTTEARTVRQDSAEPRLALSVTRTRNFKPEEIGRMAEVLAVAAATREAVRCKKTCAVNPSESSQIRAERN